MCLSLHRLWVKKYRNLSGGGGYFTIAVNIFSHAENLELDLLFLRSPVYLGFVVK